MYPMALTQSHAVGPSAELPRNLGQLYHRFIDCDIFEHRESSKLPAPTRYHFQRVKLAVSIELGPIVTEEPRRVRDLGQEPHLVNSVTRVSAPASTVNEPGQITSSIAYGGSICATPCSANCMIDTWGCTPSAQA